MPLSFTSFKKIAFPIAVIISFWVLIESSFAFESNYTINFATSSNYYLFLRVKNFSAQTVHLSFLLDNQKIETIQLLPDTSFIWKKASTSVWITRGSHQVTFQSTNHGFLLDKFEFSMDQSYHPTGMGNPISQPKSIPVLYREFSIQGMGGEVLLMYDMNNNGTIDFLTTSSKGVAVFENDGTLLWKREFTLPDYVGWHFVMRPSDINKDGYAEAIGPFVSGDSLYLAVYKGSNGKIIAKKYLPPLPQDWDYEAIQIANLDAASYPHYIIVKSNITTGHYGSFRVQALNFTAGKLIPYWVFERENSDRGIYHQPFPVDLNGDGKDELLLGYWTLKPDGSIFWEKPDGFYDNEHHMDSMRAGDIIPSHPGIEIASASGLMVMDANGNVLWRKNPYGTDAGEGQSVAIDNFRDDLPGLEVLFAFQAPDNDEILYSGNGDFLWKYDGPSLYDASFETTPICWIGDSQKEVLEQDWGRGRVISIYDEYLKLVGEVDPSEKYGQVHYRVADVTGDYREEIVCYTKDNIIIYTNDAINTRTKPSPWENDAYRKWQKNWIYY